MSYLIKIDAYTNTEQFFVEYDSQKQFNINQANLGPDWRWYDRQFTYKFNDSGYRMNQNLDDINFNNYIAFFGCSYTVGVGLPLEDTYAYKIAKGAGVDYVNAGVGGVSCDFVFYNFIKMISSAPKMPKAVIINWPDISRTSYWYQEDIIHFAPVLSFDVTDKKCSNAVKFWNQNYKTFILEDSHVANRFAFLRTSIQLICETNKIKLFEFSSEQSHKDFSKFKIEYIAWLPEWPIDLKGKDLLNFQNQNFARDILPENYSIWPASKHDKNQFGRAHPGIKFQNKVVDKFFSTYKKI